MNPKTKEPPVILVRQPEWGKLLNQLQRAGYKKAAIARVTGLTLFTIDGLLQSSAKWKGKATEPTWKAGQTILKLVEGVEHETSCNLS